LVLLVLLLFLGPLVNDLFVPDQSHLLGVAVLDVESKLGLEQDVASEVFGHLALILFVEVHEGLLGSRDDLDLGDISLTSTREIDLELFLSCARREVLDKEAEEHDRFFVLEVLHQQLLVSLLLPFCLTDVEVCKFRVCRSSCIGVFSTLNLANKGLSVLSCRRIREANEAKTL
jgi:hypothetical protein